MNQQPLVSIIINNYNYAQYLTAAIDSSLNQIYPNVEVIVVDDASTDNSQQIIANYQEQIIPILRPQNGKQAAALNDGFAASQGEILIFLDADDYLLPDAVKEIVAVWQPDTVKVHYRLSVVDRSKQFLGYCYPPETISLAVGDVWQELLRTGGYTSVPMSGNACSREVLAKLLPIPEQYKLTADDYLKICVPFHGKVAKIDSPLGAYRIHNSNQWALTEVSASRFRRFVRHDLQNYDLLLQKASEFELEVPEDLERRSLGRLWSRLASLRLEPQLHPVVADRPLQLTMWGIQSLWQYSEHNFAKRLVYTGWLLCVGLFPRAIAKLAITWLYAPHLRPKPINLTVGKIRALIS